MGATTTPINVVSKSLDAVKETPFNKLKVGNLVFKKQSRVNYEYQSLGSRLFLQFQNFQTTNQELHGKQIASGRTPKVGWYLEEKFLFLLSRKNAQIYYCTELMNSLIGIWKIHCFKVEVPLNSNIFLAKLQL